MMGLGCCSMTQAAGCFQGLMMGISEVGPSSGRVHARYCIREEEGVAIMSSAV